jgi:Magnesium chelatase, subunit ChlI
VLARRLTTILPAITLAEAIETTRIHRVAGLTGDRTAVVMTCPCRALHHTMLDVVLIGRGRCRCPTKCRWRTMACSSLMNGRRAAAMSWRSYASPSRRVFYEYNLSGVIDLATLMALVKRLQVRIP